MSYLAPRGRPSRSLDDTLIKIAAGVIVAALVVGGVRWYRGAQAADVRAITIEQERRQTLAAMAEARRIERLRLAQLDADRYRQAEANAQPAMYKCRDAAGIVAIQSWPCGSGAATEWTRIYRARDERSAAEAAQHAAEIARHEAEVARYTQMFGDQPAAATYAVGPQPSSNAARCADAKSYRDSVYRQVGNKRTFNLIRQLNDYVYEACKGT
jgi:hypothetical protein